MGCAGQDSVGREIRIESAGEAVRAWLALPPAGRGRGVLVVHDAEGLGEHVRDVCDRLAREGFVVLAPDLHCGSRAEDAQAAERLAEALEPARAGSILRAGAAALFGHEGVDGARLGVVGIGMGGQLALSAAAADGRIGAVVDLYGAPPGVPLEPEGIRAAVLGLFGEKDGIVPPPRVLALQEELRAAGVRAEMIIFDECGRAFLDDTRPDHHQPEAAAQAWRAIAAFLRAELG